MTDQEIDALLAPGREQRWRGDGRQYDRDTARLVLEHVNAQLTEAKDHVEALENELADTERENAQLRGKLQASAPPASPAMAEVRDPFADIRDKRIGELNGEQTDRAFELWLRENYMSFGRYYAEGDS